MPRVDLGAVQFDPTASGDFRLSVEGTSGTGKSNSLSVILEDLATSTLPTLVVERLGALSTVRSVDEHLVVVGGREEEGIDLVVPLQALDKIGSWVLDRQMKVLLDISTYADYEADKSRVHLAAAKAVRSINDRAHEKYRAGDRTPALVVIDEAHWLAPKDNAPNPDLDEWVKRCRGQIIKASTEGGNKGISLVVGYQRRAFLHNGVIQLCQDWVAHRPGDEDLDRTASAIRCDVETLANLGTGEIVARGPAITGGDLVGPTTVRKRTSPDPREDTFDLPETPPELTSAIEEIQAEVETEQQARRERQDELERLRSRVEDLQEQRESLEEQLADRDRLTRALENLRGGNGEADSEVAERVEDLRTERDRLQQDLESARAELDEARATIDDQTDRIEHLEAEVAELQEVAEFRDEFLERFGDPDRPAPAPDPDADLEADLREVRAERDRLQQRLEAAKTDSGTDVEVPTDYEEFLQDPVVQEQIEEAKQAEGTSPRYVKGVLATILQERGPVDRETIGDHLGIKSLSNVSKAATKLEARRVITEVDVSGNRKAWDLNTEGIREIKEARARREKTEEVMQQL